MKKNLTLFLFFALILIYVQSSSAQDTSGLNVKAFGAVGDGVTDDTKSIQTAIDQATAAHSGVYLPQGGTYLVSQVKIKNGLKSFVCYGILKGTGKSPIGILVLDGAYLNGTPVDGCFVRVNLDLSNGDIFGIHAYGCTNCTFEGNYIFGFTNSNVEKFGILLEKNSNYNKLINNKMVGFERPIKPGVGIGIFGASEPYAGFFNNGNIVPPTEPCIGNIVEKNNISLGRYAVDMLACIGSIVKDNYCFKQHHRSIYLANASNKCVISNNTCIGFGSSGVVLDYGCFNDTIANNTFKQILGYNPPGAEAAINIYTGAHSNYIYKNSIETYTNYGIYMAVNVTDNVADGNTISGYYMAGIAIESDWTKKRPPLAKYSRPNYGDPLIGDKWASKDSENNTIINNTIGEPYPGRDAASIYVAQIGTGSKTQNNTIKNNVIVRNDKNAPYLYEDKKGGLKANKISKTKDGDGNSLHESLVRGANK